MHSGGTNGADDGLNVANAFPSDRVSWANAALRRGGDGASERRTSRYLSVYVPMISSRWRLEPPRPNAFAF